ncbi:MAG: major capsid protein [Microvirus sp.]|nr:MAG: major capsid protein [Microvirus sp.]
MKRSKHSLSHYRLTTLNMGELYPVACEEVLPGDSFRHQTSALIRVSPLVAPVMHPVHLMVHSWYVPTRLLWDGWENFITGKDQTKVVPTITLSKTDTDTFRFAQSLGVGAENPPGPITLSSLPFRAYNKIWNEFYRDQDLNVPLPEHIGDTGDTITDYKVQNVSWEKDYFTTARTYPQQGPDTEVVQLALSGKLPVQGFGKRSQTFSQAANQQFYESDGTLKTYADSSTIDSGTNDQVFGVEEDPTKLGYPNVHVDLTNLDGAVNMDINEWRRSMAMQRMKEHRNRFGSRYRDMLAFLGVNSSDARLQRPEYLGGGKQTISFSEVLSTADTVNAVVGDLAGHGIAAMRTRPYKRFFEEHGYMLTFLSARPVSVYMDRVPRHFMRRDYSQYWQKELEMMGDQPVTNFEVYGDAASPAGTFGFIPRYDEYRHAESFVSGEFRTILDYWHMARKFTAQPALNGTFVSCDPTDRIYASAINDQLYAMVSHRISARRLVSKRARNA